jgi:hypothetical protein
MARTSNPYGAGDKAVKAIDRDRERERRFMMQACFKHAEDLATKLVQRLMDEHIVETTSDRDLREVFSALFTKLGDMEEFDLQFKIAPIRSMVNNPNHVSLYLTQYITEDLVQHPKVQDVFGDDQEIYRVVDSVMSKIRPQAS